MTKNTLFLLALTVSFLTVGVGCTKADINNQTSSGDSNLSFTDRNNEMAVRAVIGPGVEIVKTKTGTTTVPTKDYGVAVGIYGKSGYRFQFANCSGIPGWLTMKLGTKFMIDNRDNKSHQISIGTKIYKLAAYDFTTKLVLFSLPVPL